MPGKKAIKTGNKTQFLLYLQKEKTKKKIKEKTKAVNLLFSPRFNAR